MFGYDDNTSLLVPSQTPAAFLYKFRVYHILGKEQDDYVPFFFRKCILFMLTVLAEHGSIQKLFNIEEKQFSLGPD